MEWATTAQLKKNQNHATLNAPLGGGDDEDGETWQDRIVDEGGGRREYPVPSLDGLGVRERAHTNSAAADWRARLSGYECCRQPKRTRNHTHLEQGATRRQT